MIQQGTKEYWKAVIALSLSSYFVFAMIYLAQPLLPLFAKEFQVSPALAGLTLSVVTLTLSLSLLFYGPLSDSLGRKSIMGWTMFGAVVMTILSSFATNFHWLLLGRALQGFFLAGLPAVAMAYMSEELSPDCLSLGIGMYISANSLGGMSGRLSGGILADLWGWKVAFLVVGIVSLCFVLCFYWLLPPSKQFKKVPFRFKEVNRSMLGHLKNPVLSLAFLIGGLHFFVFLGSFNYITFLLSDEPYRLSPAFLGLLFITYLAGTVGSTLAGKLAQHWGKMRCLKFGIIIFAFGLMLTLNSSLLVIIAGLILICFGFFFSHSLCASWVNSHATTARAGASSLYLVAYYLGGSLGGIYLGWFWNAWKWTGVVSACLVILIFTFSFSFVLRRFEYKEEQSVEMKKIQLRKSS